MTVSLILPYWQRQQATDRALSRLGSLYAGFDLEVIIVDDGSPERYVPLAGMPFPVRVIRMPTKTWPLNPCVPLNLGVAQSTGDIIAISNPEMLHRTAVLVALRDEVLAAPSTYAIAACWAPEIKRWHAHSTRTPLYADRTEVLMPAGSQYHFLSVMTRDLWNAAGGFDNDFRDGAGYDDNDFLMRLDRAGAKFVMRDDLVVDHPRDGARAEWTGEMYARNRALFLSKWA